MKTRAGITSCVQEQPL